MVNNNYKSYKDESYFECTVFETGEKFWWMYHNNVATKSYTDENEIKKFIDSLKNH